MALGFAGRSSFGVALGPPVKPQRLERLLPFEMGLVAEHEPIIVGYVHPGHGDVELGLHFLPRP